MSENLATKTEDMSPPISIRQLAHYDREQYLDLLRQLTAVGTYSEAKWNQVFDTIQESNTTEIYVVYDEKDPGTLLGAGTLLLEPKFIHGGSKVGHIEDIVVSETARGRGLGRKIIEFLCRRAKEVGAYKVILDCKEDLRPFYERCGFYRAEIQMRQNL